MVTIIKVKRKINDDPADCLIIECKKKKTDSSTDSDSIKQILKYAGTAKTENDIPDRINEFKNNRRKDNIQNDYKRMKSKSTSKENIVNEVKNESKAQRYVLVNKKRGLDEQNADVNIIDVISSEYVDEVEQANDNEEKSTAKKEEILCNGVALLKEKIQQDSAESPKFIYDIYYAKNDETYLDLLYANNYNIKACSLEDDDANKNNSDEHYEDDDDDSNDESNWRNDYPDEDEGNDYYNENDHDYDEYDYRLSSMMKKSCTMENYDDDEYYDDSNYYNDDGDEDAEYKNESVAYTNYKKRILKEFSEEDL